MLPIRELADEGSIRRNELEKPTLLHDANTNIVCVSHEDQPARLGYDSKRKHETKGPPVPLYFLLTFQSSPSSGMFSVSTTIWLECELSLSASRSEGTVPWMPLLRRNMLEA